MGNALDAAIPRALEAGGKVVLDRMKSNLRAAIGRGTKVKSRSTGKLAAALGVSALLAASSTAFGVLKWLGAVYLVWVGVQMLRSAMGQDAPVKIAVGAYLAGAEGRFDTEYALAIVFRRGFLTNVLNPKVALFFLAFVPQFIAPGTAHTGGVFLALGLLFTFNSLLVCIGWALAAAWLARRAGALQRATRWLDGLAGTLFIGFGIRLALTDAPTAR